MSLHDFKKLYEKGSKTEAFTSVVVDDVLSDQVIYEIAYSLHNDNIRSDAIVELCLFLLEKPKYDSKECALRLAFMALRTQNTSFAVEFFTTKVMEEIHGSLVTLLPAADSNGDVFKLIHCWYYEYGKGSNTTFRAIEDLYKVMKAEGFQFPTQPMKIKQITSPEWIDDNECFLCHTAFTMTLRKHHCRSCGNVCCAKCSNRSVTIPHLLIQKPERVCDSCFEGFSSTAKESSGIFRIAVQDCICEITQEDAGVSSHVNPVVDDDEDVMLKQALELSRKEALEEKSRVIPISVPTTKHSILPTQTHLITSPTGTHSSILFQDNVTNTSMYPNLEKLTQHNDCNTPSCTSYPVMTSFGAEQHVFTDPVNDVNAPDPFYGHVKQSSHVEDTSILVRNFEKTMQTLNEKINESMLNHRPIISNELVQSLLQVLVSMNVGFISVREANRAEIAKYSSYLEKLENIENARRSLNDMRKMHTLKLIEQRKESDALLRIHMEQKMQFIKQQEMENRAYQQSLMEQRRQELESQIARTSRLSSLNEIRAPSSPTDHVHHRDMGILPPNPAYHQHLPTAVTAPPPCPFYRPEHNCLQAPPPGLYTPSSYGPPQVPFQTMPIPSTPGVMAYYPPSYLSPDGENCASVHMAGVQMGGVPATSVPSVVMGRPVSEQEPLPSQGGVGGGRKDPAANVPMIDELISFEPQG